MSDSQAVFDALLLRKNMLARLVSFAVLAPLTVYLAEPLTFPSDQWPLFLGLLWGFSFIATIPYLLPNYPDHLAKVTEETLVYIECIIAGVWASAFGFDLVCVWAIIAAGVYNNLAVRGLTGFVLGVLMALLGLALGALWFDLAFEITMRPGSALAVLPLFLVFMLVAETKRLGMVQEIIEIKKASDERALRIDELNKRIKEQVLVRYLPPDLIHDIFEGRLSMDTKPHPTEITVLFSDLSGFTRMSEEHGAEVVTEFLNHYLTVMNETIFEYGGTIDKFIGDAIMVIFGAPKDMSKEDQVINACRCASAMQAGMIAVNDHWQARGIDKVAMRIGVHLGDAVVGNFGSQQRVDYTAIGPCVNMASRIEAVCRPGESYVSESIVELLGDDSSTECVGEFELKGIEGKTRLYKLV